VKDWGPLGALLTLVVAVAGAGVVLWVVGILWMLLQALLALGWPLLLLVGLLPAMATGYALRRPAAPPVASQPPARLSFEQFCDQCGSRLVTGFCPYCDGV
jgi:hypothetical protein